MTLVLSGAIAVASWAIGLFFLKFWKKSHDRLFLIFAVAFWGLALERLTLLSVDPTNEARPYLYLVRLAAFLLLLAAVWDKNRRTPNQPRAGNLASADREVVRD